MNKPLKIGYHTNAGEYFSRHPEFDVPAKTGKGVDFILCHYDPIEGSVKKNCERIKQTAEAIKALGCDFIANFEHQNWVYDFKTGEHDWANRPDGSHRLNLPDAFVVAMNSQGNCLGVMYDELEHAIIHRNLSIQLGSKYKINVPVFPVSDDKDPIKQGELLSRQLKAYAEEIKSKGAETFSGEHVFAVLFHKFAENGIIPNFKSQKESFSNVQFAVAAGASLEYRMPLWNCIDLWYRNTYPGHSPEEMYNNLKFAYLSGVDLVYVEASDRFFKEKTPELTDYGQRFTAFADEYKGKERDYNVQDFEPEIGIVRYDDTFWGQGRFPLMWRNMLFGNPKIKVGKKSREYIQALNIITQGETGNGGLSWGRVELRSLTKHRSFATMNNACVFDEKVKKETLQTLKLCFLCGLTVNEETLSDIYDLVLRNGLTVVSPERFAPKGCKAPLFGNYEEYKLGKGYWIVTKTLKSPALHRHLKPFLGNKGEMRYVFNQKEIRAKIENHGNSFTVI